MCKKKKKPDFTEHRNKKQCQIKGKRKKHQNERAIRKEKVSCRDKRDFKNWGKKKSSKHFYLVSQGRIWIQENTGDKKRNDKQSSKKVNDTKEKNTET